MNTQTGIKRYQLQVGARGFLVKDLQHALGIPADGIYGPATAAAVAQRQRSNDLPGTGSAGPEEFDLLDLPRLNEFHVCISLVSALEGTSFGDCNPTDIDGAGLTMGIAGFTTRHGEVQWLLRRMEEICPGGVFDHLPENQIHSLRSLLKTPRDHVAWKRLFFGNSPRVLPLWQSALARWGQHPAMQSLQLELVLRNFWAPACQSAEELGFTSRRAQCLFLDIAVQNGGWAPRHLAVVQRNPLWITHDEPSRLRAIAEAVAICSRPRWQKDVLARKLMIATGQGEVHGHHYNLTNCAIDPILVMSADPGSAGVSPASRATPTAK